jgi:hypothetical protein
LNQRMLKSLISKRGRDLATYHTTGFLRVKRAAHRFLIANLTVASSMNRKNLPSAAISISSIRSIYILSALQSLLLPMQSSLAPTRLIRSRLLLVSTGYNAFSAAIPSISFVARELWISRERSA